MTSLPQAREFAVNGELTGEIDDNGKSIRYKSAADCRGEALVVYGTRPFVDLWLNRSINIDTGCDYGDKLTVLIIRK